MPSSIFVLGVRPRRSPILEYARHEDVLYAIKVRIFDTSLTFGQSDNDLKRVSNSASEHNPTKSSASIGECISKHPPHGHALMRV